MRLVVAAEPNLRIFRRRGRGPSPEYDPYAGQVASSADDAHEVVASGAVNATDTILRLGRDQTPEVTFVGVRFTGVMIVQGGGVPFAQLRLVSTSANSKPCVLRVYGELAANSAAFTTAAGDITGRARTTAYVDWDVPAWSPAQDDASTLSPDLAGIVQEIVDQGSWTPGNALSLLITLSPANTDTEWPQRRAFSYDNDPNAAPRLFINTTVEPVPPDPPPVPGGFSDGFDLFGLEGNESFNPSSPTLKDGTPITGDMLTYHNAVHYWRVNGTATSGDWALVNFVNRMGRADSYHSARSGQQMQQAYMTVFRLTGDLRILDKLCDGYAAHATNALTTAWSGHDCAAINARSAESCCSGSGNPWSPDLKVLYLGGGGASWTVGTDLSKGNTFKLINSTAEFAWALHLNRGKTSPAGHNYSTLADYWGAVVEGYVNSWMGPISACWHQNYRGNELVPGFARAPEGVWPAWANNGSHTALDSVPTHRYVGLLAKETSLSIPNGDGALAASQDLASRIIDFGYVECNAGPYGQHALLTRSAWLRTGDARAEWATYTNYIAWVFVQLWMTGAYRATHFTPERMRLLGRAYAQMHNADGSTGPNMIGSFTNTCLTGIDQGSTRTQLQQVINAYAAMVPFEPSDGKLSTAMTAAQNARGGGYSTPLAGLIPAAQFVRAALVAVGGLD